MIDGSQLPPTASCGPPDFYRLRYVKGTQLATATAFLREHRGDIALVTINLGANDVGNCGFNRPGRARKPSGPTSAPGSR